MSLTKTKLKKDLLEKSFEKNSSGGKREDDPKILPYYKMKAGEKMQIILVPDAEGNLVTSFSMHGPNMKNASAGKVECVYRRDKTSCPACAHGYQMYQDGNEESKKWLSKDYYIAQCVVVEAPMELPELSDGNQVRIVYLPKGVFEKIEESYKDGIIEDPTEHILVIKKTENANGRASYDNSYFNQLPIDEEILEAFEGETIEPFDLVAENIAPDGTTTADEVRDWTEKAREVLESASTSATPASGSGDSANEAPRKTTTGIGSKLNKLRKNTAQEPKEDQANETTAQEPEPAQAAADEPAPEKPASRISSRLAERRKRLAS